MPELGLGLSIPGIKVSKKSGDADAIAYIAAIEAADGQSLETSTKTAITNFIVNVKAQGGWDAIQSSCILAGARTLNGALVPLKGTAPTNVRLVSTDYSRRNGISIVSSLATPYLNTNRANNADPQNNKHLIVNITSTLQYPSSFMAGSGTASGDSSIIVNPGAIDFLRIKSNSSSNTSIEWYGNTGLAGFSRYGSITFAGFSGNNIINTNYTAASVTPTSGNITIFDTPTGTVPCSGGISFYSIGTTIYDSTNGSKAFDAIKNNLVILMTAFSTL
jgi:hypothetical protein